MQMLETPEIIVHEATPIDRVRTLGKPKLVCVDDEPLILELLERIVEIRGLDWDVESFDDSNAAWDHLRTGDADVIVTDMSMPGLSGPQLLRLLRENELTKDTPVVVLTGLNDVSLKRRFSTWAQLDLLAKPIQPDDLLAGDYKARPAAEAVSGCA